MKKRNYVHFIFSRIIYIYIYAAPTIKFHKSILLLNFKIKIIKIIVNNFLGNYIEILY